MKKKVQRVFFTFLMIGIQSALAAGGDEANDLGEISIQDGAYVFPGGNPVFPNQGFPQKGKSPFPNQAFPGAFSFVCNSNGTSAMGHTTVVATCPSGTFAISGSSDCGGIQDIERSCFSNGTTCTTSLPATSFLTQCNDNPATATSCVVCVSL